ncbi:MAG: hypothetical protein ACE5NP_03880 [Anaerolineae bacterium]
MARELPQSLKDVHAKLDLHEAKAGETWYQFNGGTVRLGHNMWIRVTVYDDKGVPQIGVPVSQEWPDGSETFDTDGQGLVTFYLGAGGKFYPPKDGPHRTYVGTPGSPMSDQVYSLGLPGGEHAEYALQFVRVAGAAAPVEPGAPTAVSDAALNAIIEAFETAAAKLRQLGGG